MSSLLVEHAAELAQDGVGTRVEVTLTRRPVTAPGEPSPHCRSCRRAPSTLAVTAELVAVNPADQPTAGTLGRTSTALCDACVAHLAPALPPALAAKESTGEAVDASVASGVLRWLGLSRAQVAGARVRLADDPPDRGGDQR